MAKFKIGDRVRVVEVDGDSDSDRSEYEEEYLELVTETTSDIEEPRCSSARIEDKTPKIYLNIPMESLFVMLGGKKYRLMEA